MESEAEPNINCPSGGTTITVLPPYQNWQTKIGSART